MSTAELAARRYIEAWLEPDRDRRAALLEACFAVDGRISVFGKPLRGRTELAAMIDAFQIDPRKPAAALTSPIEAGQTSFRFRARFTFPDGRLHAELVDIGEIDGDGRIAALYTFADPLDDVEPGGLPADAPLPRGWRSATSTCWPSATLRFANGPEVGPSVHVRGRRGLHVLVLQRTGYLVFYQLDVAAKQVNIVRVRRGHRRPIHRR